MAESPCDVVSQGLSLLPDDLERLVAELARYLMGEGWTVEIEESEDGTCEQWILC